VKFAGLNICLATARVPQLNTTFIPVKASLEERAATGRKGRLFNQCSIRKVRKER
jgi:hypothetical protein